MENGDEEYAELDAHIRRIDQAAYERLANRLDVTARLRQLLAEVDGPESEPIGFADRPRTRPACEIRQG